MCKALQNNQTIGELISKAHDENKITEVQTVYLLSKLPESDAVAIVSDLLENLVTEDTAQFFIERMIQYAN